MIEYLKAINFTTPESIPDFLKEEPNIFILDTCQRSLVLEHSANHIPLCPIINNKGSFQFYQGQKAYQFILEVLCGMQSKVIGESEIMGQFKVQMNNYRVKNYKNPMLLRILEKIIRDAKEARTLHLRHLIHNNYINILRKNILAERRNEDILILGSGEMAKDIIVHLSSLFNISVTARNPDKIQPLHKHGKIQEIPWEDSFSYARFPIIISAIGTKDYTIENANFFNVHFQNFKEKSLVIDLGSPSSLPPGLERILPQNQLFQLNEFFDLSNKIQGEKSLKIDQAMNFIQVRSQKRYVEWSMNLPFDWFALQHS